jgi:hypothetical protein
MATGVTSGWGYSVEQVAKFRPRMESGKHPLTYENNLASYPPTFINGRMVSPLTLANRSFYQKKSNNYGNVVISQKMCQQFLKNKKINPITGRRIQLNGPVYNLFMSKCKSVVPKNPTLVSRRPVLRKTVNVATVKVPSGPIEGTMGGNKYTLYPKRFLIVNGKEIKIGTKINGTIVTNIGPKRILTKDANYKERRYKISDFIKMV